MISYQYTGGSNGISCLDGSATGITRTASSDFSGAPRTYVRSAITATSSHTDITDGLNNHSGFDFVKAGSPITFYETHRNVYQGAASGTPIVSRDTCYGSTHPCIATAITLPIATVDEYETLDGVQQHGSTASFNSYGLQTEEDDFDFGGATSRGALLRQEMWAYPGSGNVALPLFDKVYDQSGALASETTYGYDETTGTGHSALVPTSGVPAHVAVSGQRGNLTTTTRYASSTATLSSYAIYEDTGDVLTATDPTGQTQLAYSGTHTYLTKITPPTPSSGVSLPLSASYEPYTGALTSTIDANGATTTYSVFDPLNRPQEITYPDGGHAYFSYSPIQTNQEHDIDGSNAKVGNYVHFDGYARMSRTAQLNGQSTNPYYDVDYCYDANGNLAFQTVPYQNAGFIAAKVCSGAGDTTTYDALGRVTKITHADSSFAQYTYHGRATQFTDENGVSRIMQVDGLGRLKTVCEISASMGGDSAGACGVDIAGTGFLTQYAYSTNNTTTITQGVQTRTFTTDWLGRTVSFKESELYAPDNVCLYVQFNRLTGREKASASEPGESKHLDHHHNTVRCSWASVDGCI